MRIDVTTAGRRTPPVGAPAVAISVIPGDDIRRAGSTTLGEALRLADGVPVARFNDGTWRIRPRGFTGTTPNKLLVMVDGRTVSSPLSAGAFWKTSDCVLEDIDRNRGDLRAGDRARGARTPSTASSPSSPATRATRRAPCYRCRRATTDPIVAQARYGARAAAASWRMYARLTTSRSS